jgi:hypothetical protein
LSSLLLTVCAGCGAKVKGTAHIVRGASTIPGPSGASPSPTALTSRIPGSNWAATPGHWWLSPNSGTLTITELDLKGSSGGSNAPLTNCTPTYQRDQAELTSVLDCSFTVSAGTYDELDISVAAAAQVLINDPTNGLYTDPSSPTGLSLTPPDGGPQAATITVASGGGNGNTIETGFATPLVVGAGESFSVTILEDMIHTVFADVTSSQAAFDTSLPAPPVALLATAGDVDGGHVEYYAPSGTAGNFWMGSSGSGNETGSLRVFYGAPNEPLFVWHVQLGSSEAWAANPAKSSSSGNFKIGGYLGLDSTGTLCWALPSDYTYSTYSELCRMKVPDGGLGSTTRIECQQMTSVPPPTSGDTYASGCPSLTPTQTTPVTLVAQ